MQLIYKLTSHLKTHTSAFTMSFAEKLRVPFALKISPLFLIVFNALYNWLFVSVFRQYLYSEDLVENYAWGISWSLGNNKHPPLFGWITAAWFKIFPASDWAYFLLNEVNFAIALTFLLLAMKTTVAENKHTLALFLTIVLTPFAMFQGLKYNANFAQLPFLTGFAWALITAVKKEQISRYLIAGVFSAAAILCKYSAVIELAAITSAVFICLRPRVASLLPGLILVGAVILIMTAPHFYWEQLHGWPSLQYMQHIPSAGMHSSLGQTGLTLLNYISVPLIFMVLAFLVYPEIKKSFSFAIAFKSGLGFYIFTLCLLGVICAALLEKVHLKAPWFIDCFIFFGWALVSLIPDSDSVTKLRSQIIIPIAVYFLAALLLLGLPMLHKRHSPYDAYALPEKVATDVSKLYHDVYKAPIAYVAGTFPLAYYVTFYSEDHPSGVYQLDLKESSWIDASTIHHSAKVVVCGHLSNEYLPKEPECSQQAIKLFGTPDNRATLHYKTINHKLSNAITDVDVNVLMYKPPR